MKPLRVTTLCGSLGPGSSNAAALEIITEHLCAAGATVFPFHELADIPALDPTQAEAPPPPVAELIGQLQAADAFVIAAPEYAGGVAGSTKNALDWMVGSGVLDKTLAAVVSAGTTGGVFATEQLVRTLSWQGAHVIATRGISAPATKRGADGHYNDPQTLADLEAVARELLAAHNGSGAERRERVAQIVTPHGIDIERFGEF